MSWKERQNYIEHMEHLRTKLIAWEKQRDRKWMQGMLQRSKQNSPQPPPGVPPGGPGGTDGQGSQWTMTHTWIGLIAWLPISALLYFKASLTVGRSLLLGLVIGATLGRLYKVVIVLGLLYAAYEIAIRFR